MTPVASASSSGFVLAMIGAILLVTLVELRRFRQEVALNDGAACLTPGPLPRGEGGKCLLKQRIQSV